MTAGAEVWNPVFETSLTEGRARETRGLAGREAVGRITMAGAFFALAIALVLLAPTHRDVHWWLYPAFAVAYAIFASNGIEIGSGLALPTELAFVPMLFMLPARSVPVVVAGGLVMSAIPDLQRRRLSLQRALVLPSNAFFALGPAALFAAVGEPGATPRGGIFLLGALAAQYACDLCGASVLEWSSLAVPPRELLRPITTSFAIDLLVAPVAYGVSIAERAQPGAVLTAVPAVAVLVLLARERRTRLDSVLELSSAYRGTAFLLGDVVEADDSYTGEHSKQVLDLVLAVSDEIGLPPRERTLAELAALLHDVGKIRIPSEIINKRGPLTGEEREVINTHTIEGEKLLTRVGGLLGEVGHIVRACHEHWDGNGYPDRLRGEEIPLVAAIVSCCDAYNAMTTDRPYRRALGREQAIAELQANSGTQFHPRVVDALLNIL